MTLTFERYYPWLYSFAAALGAWLVSMKLPADQNFASLLSASISVSAIFVGFLATAKSILMAVPNVLAMLREAGYLDKVSTYVAEAVGGNVLHCAISMAGFFQVAGAHEGYPTIWIGTAVFSLTAFWRVTRIMNALLRLDPEPPGG